MLSDQEFEQAVQVVRQMCQGESLTREKVEQGDWQNFYPLFGVDSAVELYDLVKITAGSLMDDPDADAIRNALGLRDELGGNLTERRMRYLEEVDITMRALQNRELKGAEMLVRQMVVLNRANPDIKERAELKEQIARLEARLDRAESRIYHLDLVRERSNALIAMLGATMRVARLNREEEVGGVPNDDPLARGYLLLTSLASQYVHQSAKHGEDDEQREAMIDEWFKQFDHLTGLHSQPVTGPELGELASGYPSHRKGLGSGA